MKKKAKAYLLAMTLACLAGLWLLSPALAKEAIKVTVSILPQKYFVEKIGGDRVDVTVMVLPGASPATYEPKPQQMVQLSESRVYFAIGVPFEGVWLEKFQSLNPQMTLVPTQTGVEKIPMRAHVHHDHHHPPKQGSATHSGMPDPHIWLSPPLVLLQARNIFHALCKADPEHAKSYEANYRAFVDELVDLDMDLMQKFKGADQGKRFMVYHPAWGYFAGAYGLEQIPIEMEGKEPTPKDLQQLITLARKEGIRVIFVQPQFSTKSAETIAKAIQGSVMVADPLALDWAENLLRAASAFGSAIEP